MPDRPNPAIVDITRDGVPFPSDRGSESESRILLNPVDLAYIGLKGAGAPVWDKVDGSRTVASVARELEAEFEAIPRVIRAGTSLMLETFDRWACGGLGADPWPAGAGGDSDEPGTAHRCLRARDVGHSGCDRRIRYPPASQPHAVMSRVNCRAPMRDHQERHRWY